MEKYFKNNEPKVNSYDNGIILPSKIVDNGPMWGLGGACDSDNNFISDSLYDGGWATHGGYYSWKNETYVDENVIYIGVFFQHWGHFLIDLSTRFWCIDEIKSKCPNVKIAIVGDEYPSGNNLRLFELLGIDESHIVHIEKPTRFKRVFVPTQGFKSCEWYTDKHIAMFDLITKNALDENINFSRVKNLKKVYFSRRSLGKARYSEFGEEFFENIFVENGFVSVAPEKLSLEEQIYIWNNADEIACINGTIPLNVVFSKNKNLKLTVLNKTSIFHENPYILLQFREIKADFIDVYKEPFKNHPKSLGEGPYFLGNPKNFIEYCNKSKLKYNFSFKTKLWFIKEKIKYYIAVSKIKEKTRNVLRKLIPKALIRKIRGY